MQLAAELIVAVLVGLMGVPTDATVTLAPEAERLVPAPVSVSVRSPCTEPRRLDLYVYPRDAAVLELDGEPVEAFPVGIGWAGFALDGGSAHTIEGVVQAPPGAMVGLSDGRPAGRVQCDGEIERAALVRSFRHGFDVNHPMGSVGPLAAVLVCIVLGILTFIVTLRGRGRLGGRSISGIWGGARDVGPSETISDS